jgi:hypothetical protein
MEKVLDPPCKNDDHEPWMVERDSPVDHGPGLHVNPPFCATIFINLIYPFRSCSHTLLLHSALGSVEENVKKNLRRTKNSTWRFSACLVRSVIYVAETSHLVFAWASKYRMKVWLGCNRGRMQLMYTRRVRDRWHESKRLSAGKYQRAPSPHHGAARLQ